VAQRFDHRGQARERSAALDALAEVSRHPGALRRRQLAVELRREAARRPAMIQDEAHPGE
jgi:hypothetical protein